MPSSYKEKILPYNSLDLFKIVIDIEKYPEFIPWCSASRIIQNNNDLIIADLVIRYRNFGDTFRSFVNYDKKNLIIEVKYSEGPLENLNTLWKFDTINRNKTLLKFQIDFEFKFMPFTKIIESFYVNLEDKMILAFEERANNILNN